MRLTEKAANEGGLILRTARKHHVCRGNGAAHPVFADGCTTTIRPRDRYLDCLWQAAAYESGGAHCEPCALEFFQGWVEAA